MTDLYELNKMLPTRDWVTDWAGSDRQTDKQTD